MPNITEITNKEPKLRFLLGAAIEFGGDEIAKVFFTNGEDQSVNAGQGGSVFVGGQLQLTQIELLFLRSSIGIKYVTTQANNANIRLTRFPFNNTLNVHINKNLRLGAGASIQTGIKFNGDGFVPNINFGTAVGPVFEFAYKGIGLSYTMMTYKDENNFSYNANGLGLTISGALSGKKKNKS
ncbi:hypothetical protein FA046_10355 [Pedobacter cryophilus]|uniref:Outer membrane protein beta-barrel domain-containing protein n=1 Tax=Pedobacter cryophilus TaxID=2571271 RepID=A0A4U1BY02_9SPHI|nr:hypothetical protein FA046_10355 [Pedobacter cryophilus]